MLISTRVRKAGQRPPKLHFRQCVTAQFADGFQPQPVEPAVQGMSFRGVLKAARPETLRVSTTDRVNPAGDALLLNLIDKVPHDLVNMTWTGIKRWVSHGDGAPAHLRETKADYKIGKQAPIEINALMQTLNAVMAETPELKPHISDEHVWSPQSRDFMGFGYWQRVGMAILGQRPLPLPTMGGSKLLWSLGIGVTNIVMPTGHEQKLKSWILDQKAGSVELHKMFREAYRLNKGDLYGTLLCAENVLAEGLYEPVRGEREVTKRLSYLRSDSTPQGDNFASWYHLIGSALYSLMRTPERARLVMKIENTGSLILEGKDPQEDHINSLGVQLGTGLRNIAKTGVIQPAAGQQAYINTSEFAWNRKSAANWTLAAK
jgi:hypothetical protein